MPLSSLDIVYRYSNIAAFSGNNDSSNPPNGSLSTRCLGKYISTVAWSGGVFNDLFDNITGTENSGGRNDYRCIFVANLNSSLTLYNAIAYLPSQIAGGADIEISLELSIADESVTRVVGLTSGTAQAIALTSSTDVPTNSLTGWTTVFSAPTDDSTALVIGDIPPLQCCPIWVKRTTNNTAALNLDGFTIRVEGDSPA